MTATERKERVESVEGLVEATRAVLEAFDELPLRPPGLAAAERDLRDALAGLEAELEAEVE